MMELSGVIIVLALISCVACTPYGYGVKAGAAAKAEANAASSAFGGVLPVPIPLSIPSGGGFSGSFSKSSSSSFASSSANASSSSSSFSFGGTEANGVAGNNIPSSLHGSPSAHNGFGASGSIAQAAAGASAVAGSSALSHNVGGLPCAGNNCNTAGNSNECTSNECGSSGHQHNINDNKNCLSGHCPPSSGTPNGYGSDLQTENFPSIQQQMDLDDFEVHIGGKSKSSNNLSHGHTSGFDANGSQNSCAYGKCGTNTNAASALSTDLNEPSTKNCNSPDSGCHTNLQQLATPLTTSTIEPACSTHNCNSALTGSNLNNGKPSSYNVPILGGNPGDASSNYNGNIPPTGALYNLPSGAPPKSVITPKIPSYSDGIYSSPLPTRPSGSPGCIGPNCDSLNNPSYQSLGSPSCNTPNCGVSPITSVPSSQNGFIKPGSVPASTQSVSFGVAGTEHNSGHNEYSGHSDGFLKPNPNHSTSNAGSPNVVAYPGSSEIPKTNILSTSQNNQGYTGGFGAPTGSIDAGNKPNTGSGASGAFGHGLKPGSSEPSSQSIPSYTGSFGGSVNQKNPTYTGGFGGSLGTFDTGSKIGTHVKTKPTHDEVSSGPHVAQTSGEHTGSGATAISGTESSNNHDIHKPSGNLIPPHTGISNTGYFAGASNALFGHGLNNDLKPGSSEPSSQSIPSYTGSFGGSAGSFDTNTGSHHQSKPTPENPSSASNAVPHNTGILAGSGHASLGLQKPESSLHFGHSSPSYTGGFGRPTGSADVHSEVGSHGKPHIVGGAPVTGLHGSFGIKPESVAVSPNQKSPTYTGGFGGSPGTFDTGSKIGTHVKTKPTYDEVSSGPHVAQTSGEHTGSGAKAISETGSSNNHDVHKPSGSLIPPNTGYFAGASNAYQPGLAKHDGAKTKLPPYTGGFGGPSGVLTPNEYSAPTNSPTSSLGHTSCTTGNCGSVNLPSGKEHSLSSDASAVANAKAVAYSGSFGGPPGFLKPFDDGKPSNNGHDEHTGKIIPGHDKPASGVNTEHGNTPSVLNKTPSNSVNSANAGANAASFSSSNAFSANQGISSSGCNSGCGSNHSGNDGSYASSLNSSKTGGALEGHDSPVGSLASANSAAGAAAGSFGTGRSFASSSASAHASAGAAVKGGYGRR